MIGLVLVIVCSFIPALNGLTIGILTGWFLIFAPVAGLMVCGSLKRVFKSFLSGIREALPGIILIAISASIKYVFEEGSIIPTIAERINSIAGEKNLFSIAFILFLLVLLLEFFISSSTAKAILVMGLFSVVNLGLSKQMYVLIYTLADGYTNLLFPTSPVLLIALAMIEVEYLKWVKSSIPLFLVTMALAVIFLFAGIAVGY